MTRNLAGRRPRSVQKNITLMQVQWQTFGDDLRAERTRRGLTYRQFAQLTGVNFSTLARLESFYTPCNTETFMTLVIEMGKDPRDYISRRLVGFANWIKQVD
ncbi:helix-turn-helix domain-containing protein [Labrys okinawensis]|uniref:helix-turn-helix domain-containing protein n=1 Tax=Labrys okinawensis TaxID=346911 RepID=UPI0039BC7B20